LGPHRGRYHGVVLAADRDRERAAAALRRHYVDGRLTLDELSHRTGRVLAARSTAELRGALSGLPLFPEPAQLVAQGRSLARAAVRGVILAVCTCAYLVFSFALLAAFVFTLFLHGASTTMLLAFLLVWLVPTYALARVWRRGPSRRP
jgi:Domain of unknown function (DUF1707)